MCLELRREPHAGGHGETPSFHHRGKVAWRDHPDLEFTAEQRILATEGQSRGASGAGHEVENLGPRLRLRLYESTDRTDRAGLIDRQFRDERDLGGEVPDKRRSQAGDHRRADGFILERSEETLGDARERRGRETEPPLNYYN